MTPAPRILIIDDTPAIHADFRKIFSAPLAPAANARLDNLAAAIFDSRGHITVKPDVRVDCAFQGQEGLEMVRIATEQNDPFALAFVDMRMPPGWDGLETIPRLWEADPRLQVVICTAYSDHSWPTISKRLGRSDSLIILKKPFDEIEVLQLTQALCEKWRLAAAAELKLDQLEAMVAQRTTELQRATIEAERSNRAKTVFLTTVSHELRTPLNGVLGMSSLLLQATLTPEQHEQVHTLHASGELLQSLVNDLLDISRIESGHLDLQSRPFTLRQTLDYISVLLAPKAAEKKLSWSIDTDPATPAELEGDALRLRQVLLNLVGNAIKFTDQGSVTLAVRTLDTSTDSCLLCFDVIDTGIGIAPEDQARLFTSFSQLDGSTTRRHEGAGIGLSIAHGIVRHMQGTLTVVSHPGRGSIFSVTLPFRKTAPAQPQASLSTTAKSATETSTSTKARVLVAEDNIVNQKVIQQHLRRFGLQPDIVHNGREAIAALASQRYHLVFMDCHMPELDGLAATKQIRQHESTHGLPRVPIVALTAGIMEENRDSCLAAGMNDYLAKPFNNQSIHTVLQRFLPPGTLSP